MIKTRDLKYRAEFQKPVKQKNSSGETIETWETIATRMVGVKNTDVESTTESGADYQFSTLELRTRYSAELKSEIKPGYRVIIDGKIYSIDQLGDVFTRKQLTYSISSYE